MLNRQKVLLELIRLAGGEIDRMVLTKWAFLIRHETELRGGSAFYDFVPYQYGPFSFGLYQEMEKLVAMGYVTERSSSSWAIANVKPPTVEASLQRDLEPIVGRFKNRSIDYLLDYVYDTYPKFTINSRRKKLAKPAIADLAVYSAGYEGKSIDAFLNHLVEAGIKHLIDVRSNPIARRFGFHRSTLQRLTGHLGIRYSHVPDLGISSDLRQQLETRADYDRLFKRYEATTLKTQEKAIEQVSEWVLQSPSVLVCMEAEAVCCHRARLAVPVSKITDLPIVHL